MNLEKQAEARQDGNHLSQNNNNGGENITKDA